MLSINQNSINTLIDNVIIIQSNNCLFIHMLPCISFYAFNIAVGLHNMMYLPQGLSTTLFVDMEVIYPIDSSIDHYAFYRPPLLLLTHSTYIYTCLCAR